MTARWLAVIRFTSWVLERKDSEQWTHLEYLIEYFITPAVEVRHCHNARDCTSTRLVSFSPPFFALHRGDRMAIVMTTSSGDLRSRASRPLLAPGVK